MLRDKVACHDFVVTRFGAGLLSMDYDNVQKISQSFRNVIYFHHFTGKHIFEFTKFP